MNTTLVATFLCLCCQAVAAAQCATSAADAPLPRTAERMASASPPKAELIKSAGAAQREPMIVRTALPAVEAAAAPVAEPARGQGEGHLLLAGLAVMAAIALRRYSSGAR